MSGFLADLGLALRIGLRDLRGAGRSFVVLLGALMLGVAIIAAVGILNQGVQTALERDARLLLGGDLELEQANAPVPAADLERIVPPGGSLSAQVRLSTLAAADDRTVAVSLKAVDDAYPLLGEVGLDPPMPLAEALADGGGVAEPALLARLGLAVGDSVKVGETSIQIRAVLLREPDRVGGLFSLGPRLLVGRATLDAAQVLLPGALARYEYKVALPEGTDAALFAADLQRSWPDAGWRARSPRDVQPQITRVTDRLATFLTLAGPHRTAQRRPGHRADHRDAPGTAHRHHRHAQEPGCVRRAGVHDLPGAGDAAGRGRRRAGLGFGPAAAAGGAAGARRRAADRPRSRRLCRAAAARGPGRAAHHLRVRGLAAWRSRARCRRPACFGRWSRPSRRWPRLPYLVMMGVAVLALAAVAILGVPQPAIGAWFVLTVAVAALLLWGLTRLLLLAASRLQHRGGFALRLAIANLHRPGSPSPRVIVALGAGVTLLAAVAVLASNLNNEVALRLPTRAPALYLIDVQPQQRDDRWARSWPRCRAAAWSSSCPACARGSCGSPVGPSPRSRSRTTSRGRSAATGASPMPRPCRTAPRSWPAAGGPPTMPGRPWSRSTRRSPPGYGVGLGDTLTFSVLGRNLEARIASIRREVDWSGGRLDFLFIVNPSALAGAPHTFVAAVDVPQAGETVLLDRLATRLPNVTPITLREVVGRATEVLGRVELAVDIVAGLTLGGGILALAGGILAARQRQRYETVVLKVLGARRGVLLRAFLIEYLVIGLAVALVGGLLGSLAAWLVVTQLMTIPWSPALLALLSVLAASVLAVVVVGGASLWRLIDLPAAPVLRNA